MSDSALADAILLFRRGRTRRARDLFAEELERHPKNLHALSYLGLTEAVLGEDLTKAEEKCFRAAMGSARDAQLFANLAWVQWLGGIRRAASESVASALASDTRNADALRIQKALGRRRDPAIKRLGREHPLNRTLGRLLHRLQTRTA